MKLLKNKLQLFITLAYLGLVGWWISFQHILNDQGLSVQRFSYTYGLMALTGAIIGLIACIKWGGYKTIVGKALLFFSLGLFAQECGQLIYAYYIFVAKIQIPYPSWGDVAYATSTVSYIFGAFFLTRAVGIKFSLKANSAKIIAFIVPAILLIASYWLFLHNHEYDWHQPLTVFLDMGYPLGDAIYISFGIVAFLLSRKMLGGIMRTGMLVLMIALAAQYVADWTFLFQSSRETYISGGIDDLLYLTAYFITTTAMVTLLYTYGALRSGTNSASATSPSVNEEGDV